MLKLVYSSTNTGRMLPATEREKKYSRGEKQVHYNENPMYVFLFWELRGRSPNFHIHVSVSDLHIPRIGPPTYFPLQENRQTDPGNI
jgi:hypothetical protein